MSAYIQIEPIWNIICVFSNWVFNLTILIFFFKTGYFEYFIIKIYTFGRSFELPRRFEPGIHP